MALSKDANKQFEMLSFGTIEITPEDEFKKMLESSLEKNKPLRVKCGIDPTRPDVHLGHLVPYRKMRQFQDLGHIGVVIIGDYTAQIGDPTGKNEMRAALTPAATKANAEKYMDQIFTVLDPDKTEVRYQSEWFSKINLSDVLSWAMETTAAKLLSHDTFRQRLEQNQPLGLHELFYPVLQGIDSVYCESDVELGGSDQKFNVLMGRDYQKNRNQRPQVAMLLPIITGTCGTQKMSKSLNNYIAVHDEPFDMFGKVMSVPDQQMVEYYQYVACLPQADFLKRKSEIEDKKIHPNEAKKQLATKVVSLFYGNETGKQMREQFESVFKQKKVPEDIPEFKLKGSSKLMEVLVAAEVCSSNGDVRRMIKQNAVIVVDGDKLKDAELILDDTFKGKVIKVGKRRFLRLI